MDILDRAAAGAGLYQWILGGRGLFKAEAALHDYSIVCRGGLGFWGCGKKLKKRLASSPCSVCLRVIL
jgi:hypothetical protein